MPKNPRPELVANRNPWVQQTKVPRVCKSLGYRPGRRPVVATAADHDATLSPSAAQQPRLARVGSKGPETGFQKLGNARAQPGPVPKKPRRCGPWTSAKATPALETSIDQATPCLAILEPVTVVRVARREP